MHSSSERIADSDTTVTRNHLPQSEHPSQRSWFQLRSAHAWQLLQLRSAHVWRLRCVARPYAMPAERYVPLIKSLGCKSSAAVRHASRALQASQAAAGQPRCFVIISLCCKKAEVCRPPELLLGSQSYGPEVDIWSAGCILYEMLAGSPLFGGNKEPIMLMRIIDMLGQMNWPATGIIPAAASLKQCAPPALRIDVLGQMNWPATGGIVPETVRPSAFLVP